MIWKGLQDIQLGDKSKMQNSVCVMCVLKKEMERRKFVLVCCVCIKKTLAE